MRPPEEESPQKLSRDCWPELALGGEGVALGPGERVLGCQPPAAWEPALGLVAALAQGAALLQGRVQGPPQAVVLGLGWPLAIGQAQAWGLELALAQALVPARVRLLIRVNQRQGSGVCVGLHAMQQVLVWVNRGL